LQLSRRNTEAVLRSIWQSRGLAALLLPAALLFLLIGLLRRSLYRHGALSVVRLRVPVVVIGNITVGGAGKTPLVLHLAARMTAAGRKVGILTRGYGAPAGHAREVLKDGSAADVGDEALLLKRRLGNVPVFVGHRRVDAGQALLAAYPECDLILCDDGLQHYALHRDIEIAVFDRRGVMNGWLLPAGPLREPMWRLTEVDALVLNDVILDLADGPPQYRMSLKGECFYRLDEPAQFRSVAELKTLCLHAVAGIGEPQRFFDHLNELGLKFEAHAFADHHRYNSTDLDFSGDAILATEKDAVKCAGLTSLPIWVLPVDAELEPDLARFVLEKLDGSAPA
jgi:tetraacyldisaccharide 4'-kinase